MLHKLKNLIPQKIKNVYHLMLAVIANRVFHYPAREIPIVAITGTDGKTTTAQMTTAILERAGKKVAMASTINFQIGEERWINKTKFTTLSSFAIQKFLRKAVDEQCDIAVLEISSHSLDQNRVWGVHPKIAIITNVTREHLDYHKSMKHYRSAKRKLFEVAETVIVNGEMEGPDEFLSAGQHKKILYTTSAQRVPALSSQYALIAADGVRFREIGSEFVVRNVQFTLQLPGRFNVENALAAIAATSMLDIDMVTAADALSEIREVPGRFEFVRNSRDIQIIIDYAVTPAALEKLYESIDKLRKDSKYSHPKIIAVFGACGERDSGKRPMMGKIVDSTADIIILTNEDPYFEDPDKIVSDIAQGITSKETGKTLFQIMDRKKAIEKALEIAEAGDFVVVTGKGAEETMAIRDQRIPWNDRQTIEKILYGLS